MSDIKNKALLKQYGEEIISYCEKKFGWSEPPNLFYVSDEDNYHKLLGKTAYYDPKEKNVFVYITGRHPKDILRSLAHELIHHTQNLNGELADGYFGPGYAQSNPKARKNEFDAYSKGNLTFRDWEDEKKIKFKGEQIMIENKLAKAIKLLVESKLKETFDSGAAEGAVGAEMEMTADQYLNSGNSEEDLMDLCGAENFQSAVEMFNAGQCSAGADTGGAQMAQDSGGADLEGLMSARLDSEGEDDLVESKITTPEQEKSFHDRLFGSRLVSLNARLMSNFIKK